MHAEPLVPALGDDRAAAHEHGTDHRVRLDPPAPAEREPERVTHELFGRRHAGILEGLGAGD